VSIKKGSLEAIAISLIPSELSPIDAQERNTLQDAATSGVVNFAAIHCVVSKSFAGVLTGYGNFSTFFNRLPEGWPATLWDWKSVTTPIGPKLRGKATQGEDHRLLGRLPHHTG
jgi:hypothetical protein